MYVEQLRSLQNNIYKIQEAFEGGHAPHPEDDIFLKGSSGAKQALDAMIKTYKKPKTTSVKWDGYPALIFGRGIDKKFIIADKHMFNKEDGSGRRIYSPEQFIQYDALRGVARPQLNDTISAIWSSLEKASAGTTGYFWGDLLFSQVLDDSDGMYVFRANPNGVTYKVNVDSTIGKLLSNKIAGIGVHQYMTPDIVQRAKDASSPRRKKKPTDLASSLNGGLGGLNNNTNVAILPSAMAIVPKLSVPLSDAKVVEQTIKQYGPALDQLLSFSSPQLKTDIGAYFNFKVRSGNLNNLLRDFYKFIKDRKMTVPMRKKVNDHLNNNKDGVIALMKIWAEIYKLKMNLYQQLHKADEQSPVQGYLDDGTKGQEGYVSNGYKYVDRLGFSRQNLLGKR